MYGEARRAGKACLGWHEVYPGCQHAMTIADCTLLAALDFAAFAGVEIDPSLRNIHRWYQDFKQRPSASA